jgi:hypothetical protein
MSEQGKIPGYLFGALGASEGKNETALKIIKSGVLANGGMIVNPHVADRSENMRMQKELGAKGLKDYDWERIDEVQFGIGEVSLPSIGVGREIERMLNIRRIPILALRREWPDYMSMLVEGEDDPNFELVYYKDYVHLDGIIEAFMSKLRKNTHG